MHVYAITNRVSGKVYIGKTVCRDLNLYLRRQIRNAIAGDTNKPYLYNAIRKHGGPNFSIHSLHEGSSNADLCLMERRMISLFETRNHSIGYNIAPGGDGAPVGNRYQLKKHTAATVEKMRRSHSGVSFSSEHRRNLSEARRQSYVDRPGIKAAIAASMMGNTNGTV